MASDDSSNNSDLTTPSLDQVPNKVNHDHDTENDLAEKKQHLEELRFKLEERKATHEMEVEMRKLDFAEKEQQMQDTLVGVGNDHWLKTYWRPAMAWIYAIICACDFVIFPIFWNILEVYNKQLPLTQWSPLTLQGSGLIHVAFGAILGIAAWSRGNEVTTAMTLNSQNKSQSSNN